MPHVVVKLYPGPTTEQKADLAEEIVRSLEKTLKSSRKSISVAIEEVTPDEWMDKVYKPEIEPNLQALFKKPGYGPA